MNLYRILEILVNKYKKIIEIREIFDSNNLNNYRHYYICERRYMVYKALYVVEGEIKNKILHVDGKYLYNIKKDGITGLSLHNSNFRNVKDLITTFNESIYKFLENLEKNDVIRIFI